MKNLTHPFWILITNTIPQIILVGIFLGTFRIIQSLLDPETTQLWINLGTAWAILFTLSLGYAIIALIKRRPIHWIFALLTLLTYVPYLYVYSYHSDQIIPWGIPNWMVSWDVILYGGTFIMPALAHALFVLMVGLTPDQQESNSLKSFLIALAIPASFYLFWNLVLPLWQPLESYFTQHVIIVILVVGTLLFLFFLARSVYILVSKKAAHWGAYHLLWKIPVAVIFPLLGLAINNGELDSQGANVFGNFSHPAFYILALINGIALCLPDRSQSIYRRILFGVRGGTFAFTLYFFLVFLPYLPLSVLAIAFVGAGFLMLTPLVLMVLHTRQLTTDLLYLSQDTNKKVVIGMLVFSIMVLPTTVTFNYLYQKHQLQNALAYVYQPDLEEPQIIPINHQALGKVLEQIRGHKQRRGWGNRQIPFLTPYYNWIVLGNLTLSEDKLDILSKVFIDDSEAASAPAVWVRPPIPSNVAISKHEVVSEFQTDGQFWKSWVHLDLTNMSDELSEYRTTFQLPAGSWISEYYLWIEDEEVPGILSEKKSATWIYQQIVNERRDPGILYYLTGDQVAFRVFPFDEYQTRKTGFEIIHREPVSLMIDDCPVFLGDQSQKPSVNAPLFSSDGSTAYLSSQLKKSLPKVNRVPYFHFVLDMSKSQAQNSNAQIQNVKNFLTEHDWIKNQSRITFANAYTQTITLDKGWEQELEQQVFEGGFFLERALQKTLFDTWQNKELQYPIIIVVTDSIENAILTKDLADFNTVFPESDKFYHLNQLGQLTTHSLSGDPKETLTSPFARPTDEPVLAWPNVQSPEAFISDNGQPSMIFIGPSVYEEDDSQLSQNWQAGIDLNAQWLTQTFYPEKTDKLWLPSVRASFQAHIMTPVTSFIALENEAQRLALLQKQKQVMANKPYLDVGEEQRMTEPEFWLLGVVALLIILCKANKKSKFVNSLPNFIFRQL